MAYQDLRAFLAALHEAGELHEVTAPVHPELEITEIVDRVVKAGGPALLFRNVVGYDLPVLINAFGSERRMALALGVRELEEPAARITKLLDLQVPAGLIGKLGKLRDLKDLTATPPKMVRRAPVHEVVKSGEDVDLLRDLPILKCWPSDGGRYITLPQVITRDLATGRRNVGMYRLQVYDGRTVGMHWQIHKHGAEQEEEAGRRRRRIEVAVALGGDPVLTYAATAPLPGVDEYVFAGFLRQANVELVACKTVDLEVPAQAEITIEGWVDPTERRVEGPFGDHTGYYSLPDEYPVLHVTALTHRRDPIYPTIVVGIPPQEDDWLGKASERIFLPLLRFQLPELVDLSMPFEGVFHSCVIVSIRKRYPKHAFKIANALWGLGLMSLAKLIVVVDDDVDVHDHSEVAWRAFNNVDWQHDVLTSVGPVDSLDHASYQLNWGGKIAVDATRKTAAEGYPRTWPPDVVQDPDVAAGVTRRWEEFGLPWIPSRHPESPAPHDRGA
ncbi:MAG: menaquinone biosynthesis decarboxylase [Actinomycetota bacterium]|nr:menaquinone biosynthesis decarboxylase [Actinomycetota bacterium]